VVTDEAVRCTPDSRFCVHRGGGDLLCSFDNLSTANYFDGYASTPELAWFVGTMVNCSDVDMRRSMVPIRGRASRKDENYGSA
jgi:hypothetical protein